MRRKLAAVVTVLVVVVGASACGGDDGGADDGNGANGGTETTLSPVDPADGAAPVAPGTDEAVAELAVNPEACAALGGYEELGAAEAADPGAFEAGIRTNHDAMQQLAAAAEPAWQSDADEAAEGYGWLIEQLEPYGFDMAGLPEDVRQEVGLLILGSRGEQQLRFIAAVEAGCAELEGL